MSTMTDEKQALAAVIGPTDDFERQLREKVRAAQEFARKGEELLRTMRGEAPAKLSTDPNRYSKYDPYQATLMVLQTRGVAMTKEELVEELTDGNVLTGSKKQDIAMRKGNVRRSLEANVANGNLKCLKGKFGLPEWPDEKFG